jgi:hypothetical protein
MVPIVSHEYWAYALTDRWRQEKTPFLPNLHTQRCVVLEFWEKKVILLLYTHSVKFSESGTVGFGQERGKLGTGFSRDTNFS